MTTLGTGELRESGTGCTNIGPAHYRIEWWNNTPDHLSLRVFHELRIVGHGELKRIGFYKGPWCGEVSAENISYQVYGFPEVKNSNRILILHWSCPRSPLHARHLAPEWAHEHLAPVPDIAEE